MQRITWCTILLLCSLMVAAQGNEDINVDEKRVGAFKLPALLETSQGKTIHSVKDWEKLRRPQILSLYSQYVYGKMPGKPKGMHAVVHRLSDTVLNGKAICKQITVYFTPGTDGPSMDVLLYLPKASQKPVQVFTGLNFYGNQTVTDDPEIPVTTRWVMNHDQQITGNKATGQTRGLQKNRWQVEMLINAGYGLATVYYGDVEPDFDSGWKEGVRGKLATSLGIRPEEWSAMGAWAWGLSRLLDYLETEPAVDAEKVIITGHSRLGKAALWAAANDRRFAAVVSNNSGEGGAALFRRNFGETVQRINTAFPHWFVPAFKAFNGRPDALPVDQHMLLSMVAPRPLYVASAQDDVWADPKGEFLAASYTAPVYRLYNKAALNNSDMPAVNQPVGFFVRYHIRTGRHDITAYDWEQYIRFANELVK